MFGGPLRVHGVLDRAAAAAPVRRVPGIAAQRQVHADDLVAGVDGARGGHGGVHAAAHRCQNFHPSRIEAPPCR